MTDTTSPTPAEHTALRIAFVRGEYNRINADNGSSPGSIKLWDANGEEWFFATVEDAPNVEMYLAMVATAVNERAGLLQRVRKLEEILADIESQVNHMRGVVNDKILIGYTDRYPGHAYKTLGRMVEAFDELRAALKSA